ncbi:DNA methyltransferase [Roseovarius sp. S4756]|uniref:DNA methyltransferase n=1 Tax=Roseovarius maritimus TaxID=3342637 RepID=UPI003727FF53
MLAQAWLGADMMLNTLPNANSVRTAVESSDWEYVDAETQNLTHNVHRYSGKFIPQIAARAIEILSKDSDTILDPYCGSGTTLLEAALLGRNSIGIDLSPLAALIAKVKTTPIDVSALDEQVTRLKKAVSEREALTSEPLPLFSSDTLDQSVGLEGNEKWNDEWFRKWFNDQVLKDLLFLEEQIQNIADQDIRNLAIVAFSDILRKSSNAASGYPNVMFDKRRPERPRPLRPFLRSLVKASEMVRELQGTPLSKHHPKIINASSTDMPVEVDSVDAIVTHPPYIGSIPYAEYGLLSLKWLGHDPKSLDRALTGGKRQTKDVVERFAADYQLFMKECHRTLKPGKFAFFMVGNPVVKGEKIDLRKMTIDFAESARLELVATAERVGVNRRANKMGSEFLLFFQNQL